MCFSLLWSHFGHNSPIDDFPKFRHFPLGIKKMVFVPDGILVLTPCASRPIVSANKFSQMDLVGPLIICLYSRDAPVVGSMTKFS